MRRAAHVIVGLLFSGTLCWLLVRDIDWAGATRPLERIHWGWFALANIPLWAVMFLRVFRWQLIIRSVAPDAGFRPVFSATQIGFLANMVLPARLGELVRPLTLSRLMPGVSFSQGVALAAVDRLTDLIGLLVCLLVAVTCFDASAGVVLPPDVFGTAQPIVFEGAHLERAVQMAGLVFGGLLTVVVLLVASRDWFIYVAGRLTGLLSRELSRWVTEKLTLFTDGLGAIKQPWRMACAVGLSLTLWGTFIIDNAWYFNAFGLEYAWEMTFVMQAMLMISISVPGAPGFVGQFHVPIVLALVMIGVAPDEAKGMAILFHLINVAPIFVLGMIALWMEDLRLQEVVQDERLAGESGGEDGLAGTGGSGDVRGAGDAAGAAGERSAGGRGGPDQGAGERADGGEEPADLAEGSAEGAGAAELSGGAGR